MKKFEDNIKSRFNEGEIPLDSNAFFAFEQKMKANDIRQLKFSEKIKGIFENAMIPYSAAHWNQFQQNFESSINQELNQKLNQKLKQKLEKGEIKPNSSDSSWDSMKMKLKESELTSFEKKISEKIAGGSKNYNPEHWKSLAKQLDKPKKPFIWTYLAAAAITGLTLSYVLWTPSTSEMKSKDLNGENKVGTKTEQNQANITNQSNQSQGQDQIKTNLNLSEALKNSIQSKGLKTSKTNTLNQNLEETQTTKPNQLKAYSKKNKNTISNNSNPSSKFNKSSKSNLTEDNFVNSEQHNLKNNPTNDLKKSKNLLMQICTNNANLNSNVVFLSKQNTPELPLEAKLATVPLEVSSAFNIWENPALTGVHGKRNASIKSTGNWKTTREIDVARTTENTQPFDVYGAYENQINNSGLAVGGYYHQQWEDKWTYKTLNASVSYRQKLFKSLSARFGAGLNYQNNKVHTSDLILLNSYQTNNEVVIDKVAASELDISAEEYLRLNLGAVINNPYFTIAYNLNNAGNVKMNYKSELPRSHNVITAVHLPAFNALKISALLKIDKDLITDYSPAIAVSIHNKIYTYVEYTSLSRINLLLGCQLKNKIRAYVSYGFDTEKEIQSRLINTYSVSGQISAGLNYIIVK